MANIINAITTGLGGLSTTADTSGVINFQSGGSTKASISSTGLAVTGTLTVNGASPGRSGADYATLSSGTPNITLTASSNQLQVITATAEGQTITLPDMTTCTKGTGYFTFYNTSSYAVGVKDAGGTVREYLYPSSSNSYASSPTAAVALNIEDTSTANGVWHLQNPVNAGIFSSSNLVTSTTTFAVGASRTYVFCITPTQFLVCTTNGSNQNTTAAVKLATLNTSTKTFTFGSEITLTAATFSSPYGRWTHFMCDTNGTDRALLGVVGGSIYSAQAASIDYYGIGIVGGTLYISGNSRQSIATSAVGQGCNLSGGILYTGADNAFFTAAYGGGGTAQEAKFYGYKVNIAGTTVTLSSATGSGSYSNSSSYAYTCSPTSATTFVMDDSGNSTKTYINYNTSTNALTSGVRTAQTSIISGSLISSISSQSSYKFIQASNSKIIFDSTIATIANAGTATVTVSNPNYNLKAFPAKSYASVATGAGVGAYYAVSSSNYNVLYGTSIYNCDPTNTNFNFNQASITLPSTSNYFNSATAVTSMTWAENGITTVYLYCNIVNPAVPFVS